MVSETGQLSLVKVFNGKSVMGQKVETKLNKNMTTQKTPWQKVCYYYFYIIFFFNKKG